MLDRLPLAWFAAIFVATAGSFSIYLALTEKSLPALVVGPLLLGPWAMFGGFYPAAVFLTPAFLLAYAVRAERVGYAIAGVLAALAFTRAQALQAQATLPAAPAVVKYLAHLFAAIRLEYSSPDDFTYGIKFSVATMIAGALAGWVFANITYKLRHPPAEGR